VELPDLGDVMLRSLDLRDVEYLFPFFTGLSPGTRELAPGHPSTRREVADLCLKSLDSTYFGLVISLANGGRNTQVIAYGFFVDWHLDYPQLGIVVGDKFQGKGVGWLCMQHLIEIAQLGNKRAIWLSVYKHNQRALSLYEKVGFSRISEYDLRRQYKMHFEIDLGTSVCCAGCRDGDIGCDVGW